MVGVICQHSCRLSELSGGTVISAMFCCSLWISTFSFPVCIYLYSCSCQHLLTDFNIHKYFNWNCRKSHKILWLCVTNSCYSSLILHTFCEEFGVIMSLLIVLIPWLLKISLMLDWLFGLGCVEEYRFSDVCWNTEILNLVHGRIPIAVWAHY